MTTPLDLMREYQQLGRRALETRDLDAVADMFAPDAVVYRDGTPPLIGRKQILRQWKEMFAQTEGYNLEVEYHGIPDILAMGDQHILDGGVYTLRVKDAQGRTVHETTERDFNVFALTPGGDPERAQDWKLIRQMINSPTVPE